MTNTTKVTRQYITREGYPGWQGANLVSLATGRLEKASGKQTTGVNFSVYAPHARKLQLCLFSLQDKEQQLPMFPSPSGVWHLYVEGIGAGQLYGFRADGTWRPSQSPRFNPHKLLMDPYTRELKGEFQWHQALFDYRLSAKTSAWEYNDTNSSAFVPRCVVRDTEFDWQDTPNPHVSNDSTIIYELHVKGFSQENPAIPKKLRGTYLGLCHPASVAYLKQLGITTVELLPVTSRASEERLQQMGLSNYWGYNPLCLMAPEASLAVKDPVTELKTAVRELHKAGIEVILDVVFNHTCEGGYGGPSLSMRGLSERDYYLMKEQVDSRGRKQLVSANYTGCGNTMNFDSAQTLKVTMDALRRWVEEYHIDGFRFDLAPTMARQRHRFCHDSAFFQAIYQDPVLSRHRMIAEPWDIGPEGYCLSGFPREWQEWNDRYRDGVRRFWRGNADRVADIGWRLVGSVDLFGHHRPLASINYLCSHDGFTLHDLVSYEKRHNHENGENNQDGDRHNHSFNHGVEGETNNQQIIQRRERSKRNMLATLMLSRGIPMLMAGDEFGNTQKGNNNAYCQDSHLSWLDWSWQHSDNSTASSLQVYVKDLILLRQNHPLLKAEGGRSEIQWQDRHGMLLNEYQLGQVRGGCLCIKITSDSTTTATVKALYIFLNNENVSRRFNLTDSQHQAFWFSILDTARRKPFQQEVLLTKGWHKVSAHSLVIIEEK